MNPSTPTVTAQGIAMPAIGFGTFELSDVVAEEATLRALELGYRHVDTAAMYENEGGVGRALAAAGLARDEVFVTTKIKPDQAGKRDVGPAVAASLARLNLEYVDLVLLHWPNADVPVEETVQALHATAQRGLTRAIGISNHTVAMMRRAASAAPVFTNQVEFHPFLGQQAVLTTASETGMTITAYSPVARGRVFEDDTLAEIGAAHDATTGQVALRWLLDHDNVAVLPRSSNRDHIAENLDVELSLSSAETSRIDALPKDQRLIDPPLAPDWD